MSLVVDMPPKKTEKQVRDACLRLAEKRGVLHKRMHFGRGAAAGWPDDLFLDNGRSLWVEFKGTGKQATPLQQEVHKQMRGRGAMVYVIDNLDDFAVALANLSSR